MRIIAYPKAVRDWLLINHRPYVDAQGTDNRRPALLFVSCLVFYCVYMLAMQPGWVLGGEMWAESATNYFPNASAHSIAVRFFSTDCGYIPLPLRLLAYLGHLLRLPASAIPYFYTWSAILITGGMIGAFCLEPFRALVKSDWLRFFTAIAVLMIADFETRTFVNFAYLSAFFIAILSALAFVEKDTEVPKWSWLILIFILSKPAVLSALPAMVLVASVSKPRFRLITFAAIPLGLVQIVMMTIIYPASFFVYLKYSGVEKFYASVEYFFGFLGAFFAGKSFSTELVRPLWLVIAGIGIFAVCLLPILKKRTNASALILVGLSLLYFNLLLNSFAISAEWNIGNMALLTHTQLDRRIIVAYLGMVLVLVGLIATVVEPSATRTREHSWLTHAGPAIFFVWFFAFGWFAYSGSRNRAPETPVLNNSQWQVMAEAIDSGQTVCVPVDPLGMLFERNCTQLDSRLFWLIWRKSFGFEHLQKEGSGSQITLEPPASTLGKNLLSLAILLKPQTEQSIPLNAEAILKLKDGTVKYLFGSRRLPVSGGLVMLTGKGLTPINEIQTVSIKFTVPVDIGLDARETENIPVIFWMGN